MTAIMMIIIMMIIIMIIIIIIIVIREANAQRGVLLVELATSVGNRN